MSSTTSRRLAAAAVWWFPTVASGIVAWWGAMLASPSLRAQFVPPAIGDAGLSGFLLPDLALVALPSLAAWRKVREAPEEARWSAWLATGALAYSALWSLAATLWTWSAPLGPLLMLPAAFVQAVLTYTLQPEDRWFRESRPSSTATLVAKTVGDAVLFTGGFGLLVPAVLRVFEDQYGVPRVPALPWLPCVVAIAALSLVGLASGLWMVKEGGGTPLPIDTAPTLVVAGPYAHVRNPMAAAGIAQGVLVAGALGSPLTLAYALTGMAVWQWFVRPIEEADLERRFGEAYRRYHAAVPLWIPRLRPWRP